MKKRWGRKLYAGIAIAGVALGMCACSKDHPDGKEQNEAKQGFDIDDYKGKIVESRLSYAQQIERYDEEINTVKNTEYQNLSFENCVFEPMPEIESVNVMRAGKHGISTQESWNTVKNWLEEIGKNDEIDMDQEVRIVNAQLEVNEDKETPYYYPALKDHMDIDSGAGAVVNTNDCHIQISDDGIYSMSDGKIGRYLNTGAHASNDAVGVFTEDVEASGTLQELGAKSYPLIQGELTIEQGAELTISYFEKGTPFPIEDGVSLRIPEVNVFRLGDRYGYDYVIQRIYKGMPIAYMDYGNYQTEGTAYNISGDIKHAYVVDSDGVSAYAGTNAAQPLEVLYTDNAIIGLKDAAGMLEQNLARYLKVDVHKMELVYVPITFSKAGTDEIYLPVWQLEGVNETKGEGIRIDMDVLTGEIYFYTFGEES